MTQSDLPVAILAGGLATRLRPLTDGIPKSLVPVTGEPFAVHQLRMLARHRIRSAVFCVGHLGDQIRAALGDEMFGVTISYVDDGPTLMGTGGAVRRAVPLLGKAFFVLYGDSYLDCDYTAVGEAFLRSGKPGLMTIFQNDGRWERSNVRFEDGRIVDYDKTAESPSYRHVDYGLGAFQSTVFGDYEDSAAFDLSVVYRDLVARGELAAFEVPNRFFEIGSIAGIRELERHLKGSGR